MTNKQKRYYKVGETVYVKSEKAFGEIKGLELNPSEGIYKATVEVTKKQAEDTTLIRTLKLDLWEIDKDKRKLRKKKLPVGLNKAYFQVRDFHKAFNHPASDSPTMLTQERIQNRNAWVEEELQELLDATDVVGQADAVIDAIYFLIGDLVEMGVLPDKLFDIVQEANMGKLHSIDGKLTPVYREDGKIVKPENWAELFAPEPRLVEEINKQIKRTNA